MLQILTKPVHLLHSARMQFPLSRVPILHSLILLANRSPNSIVGMSAQELQAHKY